MGTSVAIPRVGTDWQPIREAFVSRTPTPTFTELSTEFALTVSAVSRVANEENWADIRAKRIEQRMKEAGAGELILKALQGEGALIQQARELARDFCSAGQVLLQELMQSEENKISTRIAAFNNLGFALANGSRFIEALGLVGMPQDLRNSKRNAAGNDAGQPWEKGMLQQINVTVNGIKQEAEKLAKQAEPAATAEPEQKGPAGAF